MPWLPLPAGALGASASIPGIDANLVLADATGFAPFLRPEQSGMPALLPVIVELKKQPEGALEKLRNELHSCGGSVPAIYRSDRRRAPVHYCTAMVPPAQVARWLATQRGGSGEGAGCMVERFELQMPIIPQRPRPEPIDGDALRMAQERAHKSQRRVLLGVIDSGCPFAHEDLRDAGGMGTRILALWDQNAHSGFGQVGGHRPSDLGYGCEMTQAALNDLIARCTRDGVVCEEKCYAMAGYREMKYRMTHGAAVLGLLAGRVPLTMRAPNDPDEVPDWKPLEGEPARDADIVFVQLPRDSVQDSSSAGLVRLLLDGLRYIVALAGPQTEHIVVNISEGSSRGTHDGASIFERALREITINEPRLKVVLAAGNTFDERRHAVLGGDNAPRGPLALRLPPDCEHPASVIVRVPSKSRYALRVAPPGRPSESVTVKAGEAMAWPSADAPACVVVYPAPPANQAAHCALIAWPPSALEHGVARAHVAGDWSIDATSESPPAPVHFYICRNQVNPGALPRAAQGRFIDADETYDAYRPLRLARTDPVPPASPIQRQGGLTALSTLNAAWVVVAGGYLNREGDACLYSSDGPAAGNEHPRKSPDLYAPTEESFALPGIRALGSRSGDTVRAAGTSFAAPQIARLIADQAGRPVARRASRTGTARGLARLDEWIRRFAIESTSPRTRKKP